MGFIALRNPPDALVLRFDPWRMLRARWPERGEHVVTTRADGRRPDIAAQPQPVVN